MRKSSLFLFAAVLACLCGCASYSFDSDSELNRALTYLPATLPGGKGFDVLPGMRLVFAMTPLLPHGDGTSGTSQAGNIQPVPPSITRWVVPTNDDLSQEDVFVYAWLLDIAAPIPQGSHPSDPDVDGFAGLHRLAANAVADRRQPPKVAKKFYRVIRRSFRIAYRHVNAPDAPLWSARRIKYWMCSGSAADIGAEDTPAETLYFSIIDGNGHQRTLQTFGWDPWFIDTNVTEAQGVPPHYKNIFYTNPNPPVNGPPNFKGRGNLTVEIPVRFFDEHRSDYVPACTTVRDYEEATGLIVSAIRRNTAFLPAFYDQFGNRYDSPARSGLVAGSDGYFTIDFGSYDPILSAKVGTTLITGATLTKSGLLLAPGDVLLGERDLSRPTDIVVDPRIR